MFDENLVFFKYVEEFIEGKTTIQDIEDFEKKYNISLAEDYKEFLIKYNGISLGFGYKKDNKNYVMDNFYLEKIEKGYCDFFENLPEVIKTMNIYLGNNEFPDEIDIVKNKKILPIALNSSAHDYLGLCFGEDNFGKIYTWTNDWDYEVFFVCNSFKEFIEGYYLIETDEDFDPISAEKIFKIE